MRRLVISIFMFASANIIGSNVLIFLHAGESLKELYDSCLMIAALLAMVYFLPSFYQHHRHFFKGQPPIFLKKHVLWLITIGLIGLNVSGYYILSLNIASSIFSVLIVGSLGIFLFHGIHQSYYFVNHAPKAQAVLKHYFGYSY